MGAVNRSRTKKAMYNTDGETTLVKRQQWHKFLRKVKGRVYAGDKGFNGLMAGIMEICGYPKTLYETNNARKRRGLKVVRGRRKYLIS